MDTGTPGISDPGRDLVVAARAAAVAVEALPGPVAFVCALVLSGFCIDRFSFEGFVPRAKIEREHAITAGLASGGTTAFYETPRRIVATLEAIDAFAPDATLFLARELTKRFEQQIVGNAREAISGLATPVRGEIVLVLEAHIAPASVPVASEVADAIDRESATRRSRCSQKCSPTGV